MCAETRTDGTTGIEILEWDEGSMENTEEKFDEFEIEDLGEMKEKDETPAEQEPVKKKKSLVGTLLVFFGVVTFLLLVALAGTKLYRDYLKGQEEETASAGKEGEEEKALEAALEDAVKKKEEEMLQKLIEERAQGAYEGQQAILDQFRESIENGNSVVATLRQLYSDRLVLASGGTYRFIPINDALKKNDYLPENLSVLDNGELEYVQGGNVTSYKGIDVSKFQGKIDWKKVAADGVTFAIIRVGYRGYAENGKLMEDAMALDNLKGANEAGIKTGVYFYTQAITEAEALEEVGLILDMIKPYKIDCPVVIDVEKVSSSGARMNKLDPETRTKIVKTFCDAVANAGYHPMIYHNLEMATLMLDITQLEEYDKWFAYYNPEFYYPYAYKVWQYSDKGSVDGISGDVDLNIAFEPIW